MAWGTIGAGIAVLALAVLWYGLQAVALRDLHARPRVRGDNKLMWAFVILCVPYAGALGYLSLGPTSFLCRPRRIAGRARSAQRSHAARTSSVSARRPAPQSPRPAAARNDPFPRPTRPRPAAPRPAASPVYARRMVVIDPVVGTDSADLLVERSSRVPGRRSAMDVIRWPGAPLPQSYQQPDLDLHD